MLNSDEKYLILSNNAMVTLMEAHATDEINDYIWKFSIWWKFVILMKIHHFDENWLQSNQFLSQWGIFIK